MTLQRLSKKYFWLTIPLVCSLFMLGYWRDRFFDTVDHLFFQVFSASHDQPTDKYPSSFNGMMKGTLSSSEWFASLAYIFLFALHAALLVLCVHRSRRLVAYTFLIYLVLSLLCFLLILLGNLLNSSHLGYGLAQHLKHLIQSPFLVGFLLLTFQVAQTRSEPKA